MARKKERYSFAGIPRIVMESDSYQSLSGGGVKLLLEFAYQFKGHNNGDLTTAWSVLSKRGWRSKDAIKRARDELLQAGLIIVTRSAALANPGGKCALYAVTWLPIDDCPKKSLEVKPTTTPYRQFSIENKEKPRPKNGQGSSLKPVRSRPKDNKGRFISSL
jgi:hypothetical protein